MQTWELIIEIETEAEAVIDVATAPIVHLDRVRGVEDEGAMIQESNWSSPPKPRFLLVLERLSAVVKSQEGRRGNAY